MNKSKNRLVIEKHTKIGGRGRYHVPELFFSETCKKYIELSLANREGINQVYANPLTGNVLVNFNSNNTHQHILDYLEDIMIQADGRYDIFEEYKTGIDISSESFDKMSANLCPVQSSHARSWHTIEIENLLHEFDSDINEGLSIALYKQRFLQYGQNRLPQAESRSSLSILMAQFTNLPTALLGLAAGASVVTGGILDAAIIGGVLLLNGFIGYYMESQAEKTIDALKSFITPTAEIIREGEEQLLPAEQVVPGDILVLKPGTYVSADCRIVESVHLSIDESALTGESMPVGKSSYTLDVVNTPLADRENMAYMGTLVTGGFGKGIVIATGMNTEIGRLKMLLDSNKTPETPIEKQLRHMGNQLVYLGIGIGCTTFFCGLACRVSRSTNV